jgi:hypothetical protein
MQPFFLLVKLLWKEKFTKNEVILEVSIATSEKKENVKMARFL